MGGGADGARVLHGNAPFAGDTQIGQVAARRHDRRVGGGEAAEARVTVVGDVPEGERRRNGRTDRETGGEERVWMSGVALWRGVNEAGGAPGDGAGAETVRAVDVVRVDGCAARLEIHRAHLCERKGEEASGVNERRGGERGPP